jgi:protein phosphatase 2C family protein 2/3
MNKSNGIVKAYSANTYQGLVRNYNEDRVSIILNISKPEHEGNWPKCSYFGVFDGHGGCLCSDFLRDNLHKFIIEDKNFPRKPVDALKNGFLKAEN